MFGARRGIRTPKSSGFEPVVCTNLTKPVGQILVPQEGLEPSLPFGNIDLNDARLPIPPPRQYN